MSTLTGQSLLQPLQARHRLERVLDRIAAPAVVDRPAVQHLEQQPGAAPRGVFLLVGHEVARAHHLVVAVVTAAFADADAALRRAVETALVREAKVGLQLGRLIARADAEVRR